MARHADDAMILRVSDDETRMYHGISTVAFEMNTELVRSM